MYAGWSLEFYPFFEKKVLKNGNPPPKKIHMLQSKETVHFAKLFDKMLIIKMGKQSEANDNVQLYQVRTDKVATRAVQIPAYAGLFYSGDSFLVFDPANKTMTVWHGELSPEENRSRAVGILTCQAIHHDKNDLPSGRSFLS